jgi:hypothetical protein
MNICYDVTLPALSVLCRKKVSTAVVMGVTLTISKTDYKVNVNFLLKCS